MRLSTAVAVLILAVCATIGWRGQDAVRHLRGERQALVAEATALGLAVDGAAVAAGDQTRHRRAARPTVDREAEVRDFVRELLALLKDLKAGQGDAPNESALARITDMVERIYQLDAGQVQMLLDKIRTSPGIDDEARRNVIGFAIVSLADSHPEAAVAVYDAAQDLFTGENTRARRDVAAKVLGTWAAVDPMAALEWMRKTGARDAELVTDATKRTLIAGVARKNPGLAFQLIDELDLKDSGEAVRQIVGTARTPADQRAMLDVLRGLADGYEGMEALGAQMAGQGYDATIAWLSAAQPTLAEILWLTKGLDYPQTKTDSGKWMEWMGDHLPQDKVDHKVMVLMADWTTRDYQAAGGWLANTPDGPAKQAAVVGYAKTVAPYDPATAAQWVETLPAGGTRQALLQQVNAEWNRMDPAAAAAFAKKHGFVP
ncbi:MAG: hypothetical protein K9N23_10840 [Akkermansiaceae bacterium]|nr:hypothetical protein [Akkermansiaceae bacterium]MCF7732177.1 hypothetical protein [Akkermansiaceae bacterium]